MAMHYWCHFDVLFQNQITCTVSVVKAKLQPI